MVLIFFFFSLPSQEGNPIDLQVTLFDCYNPLITISVDDTCLILSIVSEDLNLLEG